MLFDVDAMFDDGILPLDLGAVPGGWVGETHFSLLILMLFVNVYRVNKSEVVGSNNEVLIQSVSRLFNHDIPTETDEATKHRVTKTYSISLRVPSRALYVIVHTPQRSH